jgi:lipopolysaccharide export system permease protein
MKILDKYIVKNFLVGYVIAFFVLIGLRVIIDLFVNLDEFTENSGLGALAVVRTIFVFYGLNATLYFRDFAGMITVVAASFSFGRMVRSGELVAIMSSGVSLKRVIAPVVVLALLLTGVLVIDQELIIPPLADKLVRGQDDVPGEESYDVWFIADGKGSLICSHRFDVKTATLWGPTIVVRQMKDDSPVRQVVGTISAAKATFNFSTGLWDLDDGRYVEKGAKGGPVTLATYDSAGLLPRDIPIRRKSAHKSLLSSRQLSALAAQGSKIKDLAQLHSQKHYRVTDPILNLVMLMISLPILVCRDPKEMKSAIIVSFGATTLCFVLTFVCKILATEVIFNRVIPELWAWLPVFVFLPVALIEIDSMKT